LARAEWSDHESTPLTTKQLVARPAARVATTLRQKTVAWPWRSAGKFVAAACVGLALAGLLRQVVPPRNSLDRAAAPPAAVAANWRLGVDGGRWAAEQGLTNHCREIVENFTVIAAPGKRTTDDAIQLACCLKCHAADRGRLVGPERVGGFVQACHACHE
jgi:hypothetical protein